MWFSVHADFEFLKSSSFYKHFTPSKKKIKVTDTIETILENLNHSKYNDTILNYTYDNKNYHVTIYNLLRKLAYERTIDERIATGRFTFSNTLSSRIIIPESNKNDINIKTIK